MSDTMALGTETGSLVNHLMSGSRQPEPEIGMGATILLWTDRHACTICEIVRFKSGDRTGQVREVHVKRDKVTRTDSLGMTDSGQEYAYEIDPFATPQVFRVNGRGELRGRYGRLSIGHRNEYRDFSF